MSPRPVRCRVLAFTLALAASAPAAAQQELFTHAYWETDAQYGWSVDVLGDLDDDGHDDLVVGAPRAGSSTDWGSVVVVSSATGDTIWREFGTTNSRSGEAVANLGDLDGDGFDDVGEGAPLSAMGGIAKGFARLWSGRTGTLLHFVAGTPLPNGARLGADLDGLGDVDDDGRSDVAIGVPGLAVAGQAAAGEVWVVSGHSGDVIRKHSGTQAGGIFGEALAGAGDVDGDGVGDLVIGAPGHDVVGADAGRVEVRSGRTGTLLFAVFGPGAGARLGAAVDGAGDVNADGFADVIVAAPGDAGDTGEVTVYLGPGGEQSWVFGGVGEDDLYGLAVAGVGDVDRDAYADVAIGARNRFEVRSGRTGAVLYAQVAGSAEDVDLGFALAGGRDLDGDGWLDVVAGAPSGAADDMTPGIVRGHDVLYRQTDFGQGGPGVALLELAGAPLDAFGQADARVRLAPPLSNTALVVSAGNLSAPFKGGILVPDPTGALITWVQTDADGAATVPGFPGGGGPFFLYLQALVADLGQVANYTISNAVRGEWLP